MAWTENIGTHYPTSPDWTAGAKVKFLHGTQSNLNSYIEENASNYGRAVEGAFYLTTDTHRLYVGRKVDSTHIVPMPVNEGVTRVATQNDLPSTANIGDFYYVESGNILAVCSAVEMQGTNRVCKWVQLNNDTSLQSASFDIDGNTSNGVTTVTVSNTITDTGSHNVGDEFKIVSGDNIQLAVTGSGTTNDKYTITISATDTTYDLGVSADTANNAGNINLTDSATTPNVDTVKIKGYKNNNEVIDKVTVNTANNAQDIIVESEVPTSFTVETAAGQDGWDMTLKRGLLSESRNNDTVVGDTVTLDPVITYGVTSGTGIDAAHTPASVHFINGTATMSDMYTAAQTDDRINYLITTSLQSNNAMHFMGVVTQASDLSASTHDFHIGDVYRVVTSTVVSSSNIATTYNGTSLDYVKVANSVPYVENGDLLIAVGTEDSNGVITSASLKFIPIPSGDEKTYSVDVSGNVATVNNTSGSSHFEILEGSSSFLDFTIDGDSKVLVSGTVSGTEVTTTLSHATVTVTNNSDVAEGLPTAAFSSSIHSRSATFDYYVYTFDTTGHVASQTKHTVTLEDTHNYLVNADNYFAVTNVTSNNNLGAHATDSVATLTVVVEDADNNSVDTAITYKSDTLKFYTADTNSNASGTVTMDIVWGSF